MKSKLFGGAVLENRIIKTVVAGNSDHDINIFILDELFNRFFKIKSGNKIKLRIIFSELFSQPALSSFNSSFSATCISLFTFTICSCGLKKSSTAFKYPTGVISSTFLKSEARATFLFR
jgi:hypothetical protein